MSFPIPPEPKEPPSWAPSRCGIVGCPRLDFDPVPLRVVNVVDRWDLGPVEQVIDVVVCTVHAAACRLHMPLPETEPGA